MSIIFAKPFKNKKVQLWARRLHVYVSMALLFIVLFFAITGITLNRPHLFVSDSPNIKHKNVMIQISFFNLTGDELNLNETKLLNYLSSKEKLSGTPSSIQSFSEIENGELIEGDLSLDYKGPGYSSTVFIDLITQQAEIEITHYGVIAVLNDLHKGRNTGQVWAWFIDISALLMILFVLTGVCLLIPKRKSFHLGVKWTAFGTLVSLLVFLLAVP